MASPKGSIQVGAGYRQGKRNSRLEGRGDGTYRFLGDHCLRTLRIIFLWPLGCGICGVHNLWLPCW